MTHSDAARTEPIPFAMIGGGFGSAVGISHRDGAQMGGVFRLAAGVFSSDAERGRAFGATVGVAPERCYATVEDLVQHESGRADGIRLASIVTPNALHAPAARTLLQSGIHVMCEKPMAVSRAEAAELQAMAGQRGLVFALAHAYSAYAMVHEARALIAQGVIGRVVMVQAQYASGWASLPIGKDARRGAIWRTDPAQAGPSSVLGDIGTHVHHLARFVTGLEITEIAAESHRHRCRPRGGRHRRDLDAVLQWRLRNDVGHDGRRRQRQRTRHPGVRRARPDRLGTGKS